ncbi:hypothetical protein NDU88_007576 [Pleurodeles waltl]|uniref:Uncharacterized protein n=1 Tax=Pleurodeles waltl TaxID=8319 RepID=A0AAV7VQ49_PLEWA|nr:hypothetical protein NDU88_007576 [Pleurodeles waltl]
MNHGTPPWDRDRPENSPRQLCDCRDPKWRPRQSSELAATAALGGEDAKVPGREAIGKYTAQVGTAALQFGVEIARKKEKKIGGCCDTKWRPRQSSEPATTAALG